MSKIPTHPPLLILVAGLPASGKTWFARALAAKLNAAHINSDAIRTELNLRGQYDAAAKQQVYNAMLDTGRQSLENGRTTVADSTFYKKKLRDPWLALAGETGASCLFIEITIPEETARQRLQKKREDSEADWEVYQKLKREWETIETPHLILDSHLLSLEEMVKKATDYLTAKP